MKSLIRLDISLVQKGIARSQNEALGIIMAGKVMVDGQVIIKAGTRVSSEAVITVAERMFVSRGGVKLRHAIIEFGLQIDGMVALDIGASTGGFTDCLLTRGAKRVYAVDVGKGLLDYKIRTDCRVGVLEKTNARYPFVLPKLVDLVVMDVSFISLEKVIPNCREHMKEGGLLVSLVKPQFEALKIDVPRGGVVKDANVHSKVLGKFITWAIAQGFRFRNLTTSPLRGASGNREFLVLLQC